MANPLLPTPPIDNSGNPLVAGSPTLADAWQYNADAAQNWIAQQRAESVRLGLVDPQTGWPTKAGLVDAARQYASGMLMGTTAPGSSGLVAPTKGIVAYHGSPHDFDAFDLSKIGTGEGAQAYGHGLYSAGNEGVAQGYRDTLSTSDLSVAGKPYDAKNLDHFAALTLRNYPDDQAAIADMQRQAADFRKIRADWAPEAAQSFQATADRIKQGNLPTISETPHGHMYEVNLNVEPQQLLDWDKPLSGQPKAVQQALDGLGVRTHGGKDPTGSEVQQMLAEKLAAPPPEVPAGWGAVAGGPVRYDSQIHDPAAASAALHQAGIPGIQYLDQGSRAAGEGSRNYVMFDPKLVSIVRKYAIPAALLSGTTPGLLASPDE